MELMSQEIWFIADLINIIHANHQTLSSVVEEAYYTQNSSQNTNFKNRCIKIFSGPGCQEQDGCFAGQVSQLMHLLLSVELRLRRWLQHRHTGDLSSESCVNRSVVLVYLGLKIGSNLNIQWSVTKLRAAIRKDWCENLR